MCIPVPRNSPLRCRLVSPTPIYEQLRGERINADVPVCDAEPQRMAHPTSHRLWDTESGPAVAAAEPVSEPGDSPASWSWFAPVDQSAPAARRAAWRAQSAHEGRRHRRKRAAEQPAGDGAESPAGSGHDSSPAGNGSGNSTGQWEPGTALPPPTHARHGHARAADDSLEPEPGPGSGAHAMRSQARPVPDWGPRHASDGEHRSAARAGHR